MVPIPLDPEREIYPGATLQVVSFQLNFFDALPQNVLASQGEIYTALKESFPLPGPAPQEVTFEISDDAPPTTRHSAAGFRFLSRRRTQSIVLTQRNLIFETSTYYKFEEFVETALNAAAAIDEIIPIPAVARVGLRYIDEIAETLLAEPDWGQYIAAPLLGVLDQFGDSEPEEFNASARLAYEENRQLIFRYGLLENPVVNANGPLIIKRKTEGRYFLFDIDSFWQAPSDEIPAFDRELLNELLYELHAPVRDIFEGSITHKLRDEVLRKEPKA